MMLIRKDFITQASVNPYLAFFPLLLLHSVENMFADVTLRNDSELSKKYPKIA